MKIEIGHMLMALSLIALITIVGYIAGHINGVEAYRMVSAAAGTVALTHLLAKLFK